jgi:small subunit ribosomal protein S7
MFYQNFRWVPQAPNKVSKISNSNALRSEPEVSNIPYSNALRSGAPNGALKTKSSVAAAVLTVPCGAPGGALKATPSVLTVPSGMKTFASFGAPDGALRTNKVQTLRVRKRSFQNLWFYTPKSSTLTPCIRSAYGIQGIRSGSYATLSSAKDTPAILLKHSNPLGSPTEKLRFPNKRSLFEGIRFGNSTTTSKAKGIQVNLRERFIQRLMLDGKKSTATKIFDESLELLKERIQRYNASTDGRSKSENLYSLATLTKDEIFIIALRKAQPWITTTSLRRGGKKVIIPEILTPSQQESIAIRWLILNSRNISGKSMAECLAGEFFGCLTNQGKTINQREQLHKLAEANRAWAN